MQANDPQSSGPGDSSSPAMIAPEHPETGVRARARAERKQRLRWLGDFLGDDSPIVRAEVRRQLLAAGRTAVPLLKRAAESPDAKVRSRARVMLGERARRESFRRLCTYVASHAIDLETALFLLARWADPELDVRPWRATLDNLAQQVQKLANDRNEELYRASALADVLGRQLGFGGNAGEFHHPDNIHLHRALARRRGMPLTLSAIYHVVGKRAGIRTALLPLPGHVMLRLYAGQKSVIVDPYDRGKLRTERDCRAYLKLNGLGYQQAWFHDASDASMLRRQLLNLQKSASVRGRRSESRAAQTLLVLLDRNPHARVKVG
ncbi:MAG: transglutaminase family protein [Planctomycetes bacterium]|nr:transglutaminase family protein [Planctomycetota bacterium]